MSSTWKAGDKCSLQINKQRYCGTVASVRRDEHAIRLVHVQVQFTDLAGITHETSIPVSSSALRAYPNNPKTW